MSGGEQQMCAIGRALMARPKLLLLDEPSLGLAPIFVERIFEIVKTINEQGTSILLVEQNALMALDARRPRLRAGDGPDRARRHGRGAEDERAGPQDLPRRDVDDSALWATARVSTPCRVRKGRAVGGGRGRQRLRIAPEPLRSATAIEV